MCQENCIIRKKQGKHINYEEKLLIDHIYILYTSTIKQK
jgi:hypothetical protein